MRYLAADTQPHSVSTIEAASTETRSTELSWEREVVRKSVHLLTVGVPLGMLWLGPRTSVVGLGIVAGIAVLCDIVRTRVSAFELLIERLFGSMLRWRERPGSEQSVLLNSATVLMVSAFLSTLLFGYENAAFGLIIFLVADALAGLIGRRFGRRTWAGGRATILGTTAFIVSGALVSLVVPGIGTAECATVVLASALVEALSPIDDNFTVPLVASGILYLL